MSEETTTETTETSTETTETTTAASNGKTSWTEGMTEDEIGWVQNRGLNDLDTGAALQQTVRDYRELEAYRGVPADRLLTMPDGTDPEAFDAFYNKLGRPEKSDGYELTFPEGIQTDEGRITSFREKAHELGLTAAQATELNKWNTEYDVGQATQTAEDAKIAFDTEVIELQNEWGTKYEERVDIADRAAQAMGLSDSDWDLLTKQLGMKNVVKMFAKVGDTMGEDKIAEGSGRAGYGQTVEQLVLQKNTLLEDISGDPARLKLYQDEKGSDFAKMEQLYNQIDKQESLQGQAPA